MTEQISLDINDDVIACRSFPADARNGESFVVLAPCGWLTAVFMDGQYVDTQTATPITMVRKWARLPD